MGTEAGYQLFPILKSLSALRKRPDDQCWAYEEQPWWSDIVSLLILTKQRIIVDHFLIAPLGVLGTQVGVPKKSDYGDVPHPGISSIHLAFSVGVCVRGT